jgi:hypothetical protein
MARETGLKPATSGVTGRMNAKDIKGAPKIAIKKSLAISIGLLADLELIARPKPMPMCMG